MARYLFMKPTKKSLITFIFLLACSSLIEKSYSSSDDSEESERDLQIYRIQGKKPCCWWSATQLSLPPSTEKLDDQNFNGFGLFPQMPNKEEDSSTTEKEPEEFTVSYVTFIKEKIEEAKHNEQSEDFSSDKESEDVMLYLRNNPVNEKALPNKDQTNSNNLFKTFATELKNPENIDSDNLKSLSDVSNSSESEATGSKPQKKVKK